MVTDLKKLKKLKGSPPHTAASVDVIAIDSRLDAEELRPLQVRIPKSIFEEFSKFAAKEYGYSHGSKKKMFLKIWEQYKASADLEKES